MPEIADGILGLMCHQLNGLNARIDGLTKLIEQHAWLDADARRLMRMPGVGPITASAIVATIGDAHQFSLDIVDQHFDRGPLPHHARQVFAVDWRGTREQHGFDPAHPFAPAQFLWPIVKLPVKVGAAFIHWFTYPIRGIHGAIP